MLAIILENGLGNLSSNPRQSFCAKALWESVNPFLLPLAMSK